MPVLVKSPQVRSAQETVLTNAVLRAASKLDVSQAALAAILDVSEATVSRMKKGDYALQADTKPFELAVLFVRLFRSLDRSGANCLDTA
jgi:DNA-binding XRE family transcriptional regulator